MTVRSWRLAFLAVAFLAAVGGARAADGIWNATTSGNYSDTAKWVSDTVADGATFTADFNAGLTSSIIVTLDGPRTIGNLSFTDTDGAANNYTISGANTLTLDADGSGGGISTITVNTSNAIIGGSSLVLAGSSNINKTGAGTLTLNTDNTAGTYTGSVTVSNGTLEVAANALRTTAVTIDSSSNDATFRLNANATTTVGGITVAAGGSGTATLSYTTANTNILSSTLTLNKDLTMFIDAFSSARLNIGAAISGTGGILKTGNGTLQLTGAKTFSGGLTVSQGGVLLLGGGKVGGTSTIMVGDANTGSNNVGVTVNQNGGTLTNDIQFTNNGSGTATLASVDNLAGSASTLSGNVQIDRNISIRNGNSGTGRNFTLSGTISGAGGVTTSVSNASNRVILTGANTYQGGTTVSTGTLLVNNTTGSGLGTGNVTVSGGTLGGTGSFTGAVTVNSGGTLAPGASIQSLASGTLTLNDSSTFAYEVNSGVATSVGGDLQVVSGGLNLNNTVTLTLANIDTIPVAFADGTTFTLINYNGAWNNGLFTYNSNLLSDGGTFAFNGQDWQIDYNATTGGSNFSTDYLPSSSFVNITAVPEPQTIGLILGAGLFCLALLRRRRR